MGIQLLHWDHLKNVDIFLFIAQKKMKMELLDFKKTLKKN